MEKKVSIVVPIYNVGEFVGECIQSLVDQTYQNIEIVLVDDGSTDNSLSICQGHAEKDSRIHVIHQENQGLISARKTGVMRATGDYVAYVDGDDWVEPEMYSHMMDCALTHDADVVAGGHKEDLPGRQEVLQNVVAHGLYTGEDLVAKIYSCMICTNHFSQFGVFSYVWGKLYRRELLQRHQLEVDEGIHIGEDAACLYPLLLDCGRFYVSNRAHYRYRQRTDSLIKTPELSEVPKTKTLYDFLAKKFSSTPHHEVLMPQLEKYVLSLLTTRTDCDSLVATSELRIFPFKEVQRGSQIALCGAGTFGQHMMRRLSRMDDLEVVAWVDELSKGYEKLGLLVGEMETLREVYFDYVLVAYIDESISTKVGEHLLEIGVSPAQIRQVDYHAHNVNGILHDLGFFATVPYE